MTVHSNKMVFTAVIRIFSVAMFCSLGVLPAYSIAEYDIDYVIVSDRSGPLSPLEDGTKTETLEFTLIRLVDGNVSGYTLLGGFPSFGIGADKLVTFANDPWDPARKNVLTVWDYRSGVKEFQFINSEAWPPRGFVEPRNVFAISFSGETLWHINVNSTNEPVFALMQCLIASGTCQLFDFPIPIDRNRGFRLAAYQEGVLVCNHRAVNEVLYFENETFVSLPSDWTFEFPDMPASETHFTLSCVPIRGGFAHIADNGYVHLLRQHDELQINLTMLDDSDLPTVNKRVDRWVSPQVRLVEGTELLFLGEMVRTGVPSRWNTIKAVIALNTEDGTVVDRWLIEGEVEDFIVTPSGDIRFVDPAMNAIREYDTLTETVQTLVEFPGDVVTKITLIPMP